jgi:hypothetical protein
MSNPDGLFRLIGGMLLYLALAQLSLLATVVGFGYVLFTGNALPSWALLTLSGLTAVISVCALVLSKTFGASQGVDQFASLYYFFAPLSVCLFSLCLYFFRVPGSNMRWWISIFLAIHILVIVIAWYYFRQS